MPRATMPDPRPPLTDRLEQLRTDYRRGLQPRFEQIAALWRRCLEGDGDRQLVSELRAVVHRLAGSGDTFGFPDVSQRAERLERFLSVLSRAAATPTREQRASGDALVAELTRSDFAVPAATADPPLVAGPDPLPGASTPEVRRRLFLVEDDKELARSLRVPLLHFGYDTRVFAELLASVHALASDPPDAIVMDVAFSDGELAGPVAASELKRLLEKGPPVVFISARDDLQSRLSAFRSHGCAYLTKPVDVGELVEWLDRLTGRVSTEPFRILLVEDEPILAEYLAHVLREAEMEVESLQDPGGLLDVLEDLRPDLIVMDHHLPDCTGFELAAVLQQHRDHVSIPIVFLSVERDAEIRRRALSLGSDAFLEKPVQPAALVATVTDRAQRARALRALIARDGLTGLFNHSQFKTMLVKELHRAGRYGVPGALALIDLDHFKTVNDRFGHVEGDRVLRRLARLLRQRLRQTDVIGRYGGEEFGIIFTNTPAAQAHRTVDRIRDAWSRLRHMCGSETYRVTLSAGVTALRDENGDGVLEAADGALYAAKRSGRNTVVLADGAPEPGEGADSGEPG